MKLNIKLTDDNLARDGAWVDWTAVEGISVKMKRSSLAEPQKQLLKIAKQNRKVLRNSDAETQKQLMIKFLAEHIVVGWKGITDDGKEFKFSIENCMIALAEDQDFYAWVLAECDNPYNFAGEDDSTVEERGEELKKS